MEPLNGYLNFFIDPADFARRTLGAVAEQGEAYGSSDRGKGKTVVIDYSSPNMGKELAFHHLRGTMIGNSLGKLYKRAGYKVVRINHLGDWGTSYGKLIVMFLREGLQESDLAEMTIERLNALYTDFSNAAKDDADPGRPGARSLPTPGSGGCALPGTVAGVQGHHPEGAATHLRVPGRGVRQLHGRSFFPGPYAQDDGPLASKGMVTPSQGAEIVDLSQHNMPPVMLRKSDGATLYITRDIAAAIHRKASMASTSASTWWTTARACTSSN